MYALCTGSNPFREQFENQIHKYCNKVSKELVFCSKTLGYLTFDDLDILKVEVKGIDSLNNKYGKEEQK